MNFTVPRPPWSALGRRLESSVRKALFEFEMLGNARKIAVALSGGKDSLTLLVLLKAISGRGFPDLEIHAIHVGGPFSCGAGVSRDYLAKFCSELDIPLITRESTQKLETLECYSCSRERRRLIFHAALEAGVETVAFGHHRDDNAQTVLMNLFNKGSFEGNLPKVHMHDYGVTIIRPLIYIAEQDIRTFAQQQGFARITCRCPVGQNSMRKQVEDLIKHIEQTYPNVRSNVAHAGLQYGTRKAAKLSLETK
jgi:tRNA(Ile)-lysidine synthase TilS/MesJ